MLIWGNWIQGLKSYQWWMMQSELVPPRIWTAGPNPPPSHQCCALKHFLHLLWPKPMFLSSPTQEIFFISWEWFFRNYGIKTIFWLLTVLFCEELSWKFLEFLAVLSKIIKSTSRFFNNILLFASELLTISNN